MPLRGRTTACLGIAAAILGLAASAPLAHASAPRALHAPVRTVTPVRGGYITRIAYPDGTVVRAFASVPMRAAAAPVTRPVTTQGADGRATTSHSLSGELVPASPSAVTGVAKSALPPVTPSAYEQVIALGATPAEAAPFLAMAAPPQRTGGAAAAVTTSSIQPMTSPGPDQLWDTSCVDVDFAGSHGHLYGCDNQYRVWINPNDRFDWYMQDRFLASASMHDTALINPDEVTGLKFGIHYPTGNQITNWSPIQTVDVGSCTTKSASVSVKGFTISSSATECPEAWGLYYIGPLNFTTKWDGKGSGPHDGSRSTHGVASVHSPSGASWGRTLPWEVWWD